ncbi:hypothetical protein SAMN04515674_105221 [Pseudarcicella hirudinis]|uniref:SSD domain-containing protein n=2 Tax=Pseudarcicella hirudinis TaxID=1079859 RepID=A0A1I5SUN5_9BACT|nr:MMPL family transporter [Pseudarcicella hirudinis]SFP74482.1 hypothetical protein SAMN04515674_105221 [Pseudarcicella hirudinis]
MKQFWHNLARTILNHRILSLVLLAILTIFMSIEASKVQLSYELAKILPKTDERFKLYESFKQRYGEDGAVMVIAAETDHMYDLNTFQHWYDLGEIIKNTGGIKDVISNANLPVLKKDEAAKKFVTDKILDKRPQTQAEVDAVREKIKNLPVYQDFIYNDAGNVHLMMVTFNQKTINDHSRIDIVKRIKKMALDFGNANQVKMHFSGMPFIRTEFTSQVTHELGLFLLLAIGVTSLILAIFFRSLKVVIFALIVVLIGIVSSLGIIVLFGFKITLLSGLIPPLIVVISIPNTIFLLNKYHEEYSLHGNKIQALSTSIEKVGQTLFLANLTTFVGFGVFAFTGSALLVEFGIVASINVMLIYLVSLVFIPIVFSYLPPPSAKNTAHLEAKRLTKVLTTINFWVNNHRGLIYAIIVLIVGTSVYGMTKIQAIGYIVDDLPRDNAIFTDLKFIEKNFKGVMPFEVNIDAYKPGRALTPQLLTKIKRMEKEFAKFPEFTKGLSLVTATKFIYQAYRGGNPKYFVLPGIDELNKLKEFNASLEGKQNSFNGFIDSTKRYTRVSFQMADVGTVRTNELIKILQPKIDSIFNYDAEAGIMHKIGDPEGYNAQITGNSVVYAWQNDYLQKNLVESTFQAIILICLIMALLFRSWKMVLISTLPSLIPLIITAGLMGFFGIALKPTTILIFSIAFGISSDGTIYFLTRYKDELLSKNRTIAQAVTETILNTGVSMFYTVVILFSGFFIFTASTFKGTQALGILISVTLLMAMICNLILLPAFLMTINKSDSRKKH